MTAAADMPTRRRSLVPLVVLVVIFALPPLAGWVLYFNPQLLPDRQSNNGVLLQPARPVTGTALYRPDGEQLRWDDFDNKWTLVVFGRGGCDAGCRERLEQVGQIRRALGANRLRVERLLILLPAPDRTAPVVPPPEGLEDVRVALAQAGEATELESLFQTGNTFSTGSIYVIDPHKMVMMMHDPTVLTSKQILKDLEKLLKASENWVTGTQNDHE